ncbi:MAG: hypothetical protein KJ063_25610, partial [Anaerolineae bacterium]|nr:hypothetical protein [Anaerolineae bacterium]
IVTFFHLSMWSSFWGQLYPSLEIYQYYDGSLVRTLIQLSPTGWGTTVFGPILGLNPLAPNQINIRIYHSGGGNGTGLESIILPY